MTFTLVKMLPVACSELTPCMHSTLLVLEMTYHCRIPMVFLQGTYSVYITGESLSSFVLLRSHNKQLC